jgi:UDP-N-acetylmuramyl pentapeptide phosphotransferase/UDP-N-acetylglucosamine-1-phosphate transferase
MNNYFYLLIYIFILLAFLKSYNIGKKLNVLSYPDNIRKFHKKPVPQAGGIILFFALIFFAILDNKFFFLL